MPDEVPPFAPERATFPCPALLACAARASLGGAREALLGAVMAARLASGMRPPCAVSASARAARAEGARQWLGAITLPARQRAALLRAFAATGGDEPAAAADAIAQVIEVTAPNLDRGARSDLGRLVDGLRGDARALAAARDRPVE